MSNAPQYTCECECHSGFDKPCSIPGGCGHLHQVPDAGKLTERPQWACVMHRPPANGRSWVRPDEGYRTCRGCAERLAQLLREVAERYVRLNPAPGAQSAGGRGAPGFVSKPPCSLHVVAMRDPRSSADAHVWVGSDGRVHEEDDRPPLSVFGVLDTIAWDVAEARGMDGHGQDHVVGLCRWLRGQLDWLTRRDDVVALDGTLRSLLSQLKAATGERRVAVGRCTRVVDEGEHTRECGARLYAPLRGDTIHCRGCGSDWPRSEWLRLGELLDVS